MKLHVGSILLLILICGLSGLFALNTTIAWRELGSLFGVAKPFRQGHTAGMTTFGRMISFSGLDNTLTGILTTDRFNYLSNSQIQILASAAQNDRPSREKCAYGLWKDRYLVLYGGIKGGQPTKELLIFDSNQGVWLPNITTFLTSPVFNVENHFIFGAEGPSGAIDNDGDELWLFGGSSTILQLNFLTRVDLHTYEFHQVNLTATTSVPDRRYGAALAFYGGANPATDPHFLWLYGGEKGLGNPPQNAQVFNDMFKFDIAGSAWSAAATPAPASGRAYMATIVLTDKRHWILFGGLDDVSAATISIFNDVFRFDMSTGVWETLAPACSPFCPSGRGNLVAVHLGWTGEDSVLFHGGEDDTGGSLNNFWKLQLLSSGTSPVPPPPNLDQGTDIIDPGTNLPPAHTSHHSSAAPPGPVHVLPSAASALTSWLSLLWV